MNHHFIGTPLKRFFHPKIKVLPVLDITFQDSIFNIKIDTTANTSALNINKAKLVFTSNTSEKKHFFPIHFTQENKHGFANILININNFSQLEKDQWRIEIISNNFLVNHRFLLKVPDYLISSLKSNPIYIQPYYFLFNANKEQHLTLEMLKLDPQKPRYFPHSIHSINFKDGCFSIKGSVCLNFIEDVKITSVGIFMKMRNKTFTKDFNIQWINPSNWEINIPIKELPNKPGTFDFYFQVMIDSNKLIFRLKQLKQLDSIRIKGYHPHELKGTISYHAYRTQNNSFSIKAEVETVAINDIQLINKNDMITLSGNIYSDLKVTKNTKLIFMDRDNFEKFEFDVEWIENNNQSVMKVNMDTKLLYQPKEKVFDVFICTLVNNEELLFRVKTDAENLNRNTLVEVMTNNTIFQYFFYSTKRGNLSFTSTPPLVERDIKTAVFKEGNLHIKGSAFIYRPDPIRMKEQKLMLVFRNRNTLESLEWILNETSFEICVPLNKLLLLINDFKETIDIYIKIIDGHYTQERKLGFNEFTYIKDDYLSSTRLVENETTIQMYLTISPFGNIKLETAKLNQECIEIIDHQANYFNPKQQVWIVGERPNTAQDTGFHFFKYMRENFPEMNVYYAIEPGSLDVENLKPLGNVLHIGSKEHVEMSIRATAFFSSHDIDYILPIKAKDIHQYPNVLKVFLQHGVMGRKSAQYHKKYYHFPYNIFCVSSSKEKELIIDTFGYTENEVKVTGLSRFDNLHGKSTAEENRILLIPTWRIWINSQEQLMESEYFNRYLSLLRNPKLHSILEKYDLYLDFYPHYRMQLLIKDLDIAIHPRINMVKLGLETVQNLLIKSKLMVTDFSSVSFDFNYMKKPVIFYHFDFRHFFSRGLLRPMEETFLGDIVHDEEQLIERMEAYILNGFKEKAWVSIERHQVLDHIDKNNCKRIYKEAMDYLNNKV